MSAAEYKIAFNTSSGADQTVNTIRKTDGFFYHLIGDFTIKISQLNHDMPPTLLESNQVILPSVFYINWKWTILNTTWDVKQ